MPAAHTPVVRGRTERIHRAVRGHDPVALARDLIGAAGRVRQAFGARTVLHERGGIDVEHVDAVVDGRGPDRLTALTAEELPDRRSTDAVVGRPRVEVLPLGGRIRVAAQQRDLRGHPGRGCREAARRKGRLELLLVGTRRSCAPIVVRVQARVVVEAAADLSVAGERQPRALEHRLRERDIAAHTLRASLVDEDLRERLHRVPRNVREVGWIVRHRRVPTRELGRSEQVRPHHRRLRRDCRTRGRECRGDRHDAERQADTRREKQAQRTSHIPLHFGNWDRGDDHPTSTGLGFHRWAELRGTTLALSRDQM